MWEELKMALSKLEKIFITLGFVGSIIVGNIEINKDKDKDILTRGGYLVTIASFGYVLNKLYRES